MDYYKLLHLKKEPFSNSPDPAFFYRSRQHVDCLQKIELALRLKRGLNVVVGDVGTGKTTLCRQLLQSFSGDDRIVSRLILDPDFQDPQVFLGAVLHMFTGQLPPPGTPISKMKEALKQYLFQKGLEEKKTVVLIIDEGQKLTTAGLEILRELLNFETNEFKLLQIIIFAQTEFDTTLSAHANVVDRVNLYLRLFPLNFKETRSLIRFRISQATGGPHNGNVFFSFPALWQIYRYSEGYPRKIIHLCHQCLLAMIIQNRARVGRRLVSACAKRTIANAVRLRPVFLASLFVIVSIGMGLWVGPDFLKSQLPGLSETQPTAAPLALPRLPFEEIGGIRTPMETIHRTAPLPSFGMSPPLARSPIQSPSQGRQAAELKPSIAPSPSPPNEIAPPDILGEVSVAAGNTLTKMIAYVYGAYRYRHYQAVLNENAHITNPDHLLVGERVRFPAIAEPPQRVPPATWWLVFAETSTLADGLTLLNHAKSEAPSLRLLPYWNRKEGLKFMIAHRTCFMDKTSAEIQEKQPASFSLGEKKIICLEKDDTIIFGIPFI